ncbi:uncharacterized protein MEPE_01711 [Melanopsichium pennsylvanicum]|uniref:Uncharacterized protein n=1 Tax=Melanopsichium pennsylvanicum TaxID=63383 RepID=A0AAJ4XIX7_9BASI|nr:uncharacterized protein MEPE_01711 [Melanopsichium pennsylvanicum]
MCMRYAQSFELLHKQAQKDPMMADQKVGYSSQPHIFLKQTLQDADNFCRRIHPDSIVMQWALHRNEFAYACLCTSASKPIKTTQTH